MDQVNEMVKFVADGEKGCIDLGTMDVSLKDQC